MKNVSLMELLTSKFNRMKKRSEMAKIRSGARNREGFQSHLASSGVKRTSSRVIQTVLESGCGVSGSRVGWPSTMRSFPRPRASSVHVRSSGARLSGATCSEVHFP